MTPDRRTDHMTHDPSGPVRGKGRHAIAGPEPSVTGVARVTCMCEATRASGKEANAAIGSTPPRGSPVTPTRPEARRWG